MPNSGAKFFATIIDDAAVGTRPWVNPTNAGADDGTYTTVAMLNTDSHYLNCQNASFSIPANSIVTGVVVEIQGKESTGVATDKVVSLINNGAVNGSNLFNGTAWTAADTIFTYGSSTNLWGNTLTPAIVNDTDFGVVLQVENTTGGNVSAQVDYVSMTVYFNIAPFSQSIIIY